MRFEGSPGGPGGVGRLSEGPGVVGSSTLRSARGREAHPEARKESVGTPRGP